MRIVFMGTPDFAVPSLEALINKHDVVAVYCQPDKPKGRGHKLAFPPVKELALEHDIEVKQPASLRNEAVINELAAYEPDVIIVVAYGKILPKEILDIPPYGCINVHGSLLPKYRGAAPIQWAVINGDKTTGITTMYVAEGLDSGDIILKNETEIGENETSAELFERLKDMGAELLIKTLEQVEAGIAPRIPQNESEATLAPMLNKDMGYIDWSKTAEEVHNLVRGLNSWPGAYSFLDGRKLKIHAVSLVDGDDEAGKAISENGAFKVFCGSGAVLLEEIQPENSKRMSGKSYLLGHKLENDARLT